MSLKLGNVDVSKVMLGSSGVSVVYKGTDEVWRLSSAGGYGDDVFSTYVYDGTGAAQDIENGVDLAGEGGMVWLKNRTVARGHSLYDTERGAGWKLSSERTDQSNSYPDTLTSFNSDGFSLGADGSLFANENGADYASWTFRKAPKVFDVVKYTPTSMPYQVPHNLGCTPGMIIVKNLDTAKDWPVWHRSLSSLPGGDDSSNLKLNDTGAIAGTGDITSATDTNFTVGGRAESGSMGQSYVAYVFASDESDESLIKCGSYTGNGKTFREILTSKLDKSDKSVRAGEGPEIDLGFEPQFLMVKAASRSGPWTMVDVIRGINTTSKGESMILRANEAIQEQEVESFTVNPRGFSTFSTNSAYNQSGAEYIYMAIRRPNKPAEEFAPEELFAVTPSTNTSPRYVSGFPVDMGIRRFVTDSSGNYIHSRLTGNVKLWTNTTGQESASDDAWMDYNNGMTSPNYVAPDANRLAWMWRRAPGFFDVVTYTGNDQTSQAIPHNLSVAPEMIWVKARTQSYHWTVYQKDMTASKYLWLDDLGGQRTSDEAFYNTEPTEEVFTVGYDNAVNNNNYPYIAYLFASVPGISKVGSYEGNGSNDGPTVECGFVPRMVMVKNMDGNGSWELMDSVRGFTNIISLNNENVQIFDSLIEATTSGFKVTNGAGNVNTAGKNYLFYAIA